MSDQPHDHANVVAPPPLIYAGALVAGLLLQRYRPLPVLPARVGRPLGALLIGLNFLIAIPAVLGMRRARTSLNPAAPTTAIVTSGPFGYTRNPIYLSFAILYAGIALFRNALWPLLLLPGVLTVMTKGVIEREERYLTRLFGEDYTRYCERVRRWV